MMDKVINFIIALMVTLTIIALALLAFSGVGTVLEWIQHFTKSII